MSELKFVKKFKIPALSRFASDDKEVCPYEKFHNWVAKQMGGTPKDKKINVSGSWVTPEVDEALRELAVKWAMKTHKLGKKRANDQVVWLHLEISPATFPAETILMPDSSYVYVREDLFDNPVGHGR